MNSTPVDQVQQKYKSIQKVDKFSKKWNKQTQLLAQPWPIDGTFDIEVINKIMSMIGQQQKELRDEMIAIKGFLEIAEEKLGLGPVLKLIAQGHSETRENINTIQSGGATATVVVLLTSPQSTGIAEEPPRPQWGRGAPGQRNFGRGGRPGFNPSRNTSFACFACGKIGHKARNCYFKAQWGRGNIKPLPK